MGRSKARPASVINLNSSSGAVAENHSYPVRTPVLELRFGSVQVLVTTSAADEVTAADVEFARCLAREAATFARSVERAFHGLPDGRGVAA
ncbi:hypothetical protein GCM10023194_78300 [Planotetraspora phitsanulokensis]|uniref:Uncharacterized protein n=1 Tax=Planotetraspora phitsanulokensis TaxID=575192 RepID=A0A8J3UD37_9ACTN|nr:hypothetical protein [Planotetraspora phitsanulokensis]GII41116.1 hypothetical protein Pph01_61190 [Planotetraspora phitsanulokensis]